MIDESMQRYINLRHVHIGSLLTYFFSDMLSVEY